MKLVWNRLWAQSERTKDLLNVFSYANKSSAALKEEAAQHKSKKRKNRNAKKMKMKNALIPEHSWLG